jgi:NCS1 family nucleobase:cation symporter-1
LRADPYVTPAQNWRAALALIISVSPLIPGLINSINPNIPIGGASHLFSIAWFFGFSVASTVYTTTSLVFPAEETFLTDEEADELREREVEEIEVTDEKREDGA